MQGWWMRLRAKRERKSNGKGHAGVDLSDDEDCVSVESNGV